jgi:uncharacterized damage-inducible protein DinB
MSPTIEELTGAVDSEAAHQLQEATKKITHCLSQLSDEQVWWRQSDSQNSIANVLLHLCGNVRQWIVSGIGGEPDIRDRPKEFSERQMIPKAELLRRLDDVVGHATAVLSRVSAAELLTSRRVQGFDVTGLEAIFKVVTHFVGHAHQIVYITRYLLGDAYRFEWAPTTPEQGVAK